MRSKLLKQIAPKAFTRLETAIKASIQFMLTAKNPFEAIAFMGTVSGLTLAYRIITGKQYEGLPEDLKHKLEGTTRSLEYALDTEK